MNYYPFHIGDYVSATRHLSWEEDAAFRRLLDTYYTTEKPIPSDHRSACRLVMATTESQRDAVRVVLEEFFIPTPDGWINKRADDEIAAMREKQRKQKDKANKRWDMQRAELGNAPAMPRHRERHAVASEIDADAMPPTPTPTPTPTPEGLRGDTPLNKPPARKRASASAKTLDSEALEREGVDPQHARDWIAVRKAKDLPLTQTAWDGTVAEAAKAGVSPAEAVRLSAMNGWGGFRASWLQARDSPRGNGSRVPVGAMSEHGLQTMRNANALKARLFSGEEARETE